MGRASGEGRRGNRRCRDGLKRGVVCTHTLSHSDILQHISGQCGSMHMAYYMLAVTKVYFTSPEPSTISHNLLISYQISKFHTPEVSLCASASNGTFHYV